MKKLTNNQSGFSAIFIIGLIAAGIITGTLLVQNGVSFLPKAAEQGATGYEGDIDESGEKCSQPVIQRCEADTLISEVWELNGEQQCQLRIRSQKNPQSCPVENKPEEKPAENQNPPQESKPDQQTQQNRPAEPGINVGVSESQLKNCTDDTCRNRVCEEDKIVYCDNREGRPRAMRKTGGYFDSQSGKCVFDFFEVPEKNSECGKTESKSGDVVSTTIEEAKKIDEERAKTLPERQRQSQSNQSGSNPSSQTPGSTSNTGSVQACLQKAAGQTKETNEVFKDEKVSGNLVRFYAILEGVKGYCVPADLGVGSQETANAAGGGSGRLLLCSDPKEDGKLVWNVIVGNQLKPAEGKGTPTIAATKETYEAGPQKERLKQARQAAGLE